MRRAGGTSTQVIVNDRADIARAAGAHGVHVGQDDLSAAEVRAIVGESAIVGVSTHTREQIDRALESSASYVAVGPIFATNTKATGYDARGIGSGALPAGRGKPVVAIGGITLQRAPEVIAAGARAVAVITDLLEDGDVERRVRAFVTRPSASSVQGMCVYCVQPGSQDADKSDPAKPPANPPSEQIQQTKG